MGLAASQGRLLLLTARKSDLEYRAQQISQRRLLLSQELEAISTEYEEATSNRQMSITLWAGGTSSTDGSNITTNLTYAALMSGTATYDSSISGVNIDSSTYDGYSSSVAYRLVDSNGAIVVSSTDEIPTTISDTTTTTTISQTNNTNFYTTTTTITSSNEENNSEETSYCYIAQKGTDIYNALNFTDTGTAESDSDGNEYTFQYYKSNGISYIGVSTDGGETYTYYRASSGDAVDSVGESGEDPISGITTYQEGGSDASGITEGTTTTLSLSSESDSNTTLEELGNSKYKLTLSDGSVVYYIVDQSLANATSASNGTTSDVNYLQDCIRNGKYLIQKYNTDSEEWSNMSWENASNITDSYYTDDDAAAKAKYDRLSNEIEAQDKKLELELDNIETQRSAVSTEQESVEKVIDENIEGSFNAFA